MALSMDDQLLGEKVDNYCSSSEDEDDGKPSFISEPELNQYQGFSTNTGPKGVINDWRRYKQLENEKKQEQEQEKLDLMKKLSITCRTKAEDEQADKEDEELELELEELEDQFIKEYRQRRIEEMKLLFENIPKFGKVLTVNKERFIDEIDKEKPTVTVIVHIYEEGVRACEAMDGSIACLAQEYPTVKFCRMSASDAKLSRKFATSAVPALLVYKKGELIGNFIRLADDLGEDFFMADVEGFLLEHGMLPDKSVNIVPTASSTIRQSQPQGDESDSDFDVD